MEEAKGQKPVKKKAKKVNLPLCGLALFLLGAFSIVAIRFFSIKNTAVHYHANFALYINGQRDEFSSFTFYEEVQSCTVHDKNDLKAHAHLHDQNPSLVHVHADGVTWGQFFANLGYTLGNKVVVTDAGVYINGQDGNKLSFLLNGQSVQTVENRIIGNEDVLLINYGKDSDQVLQQRYAAIPRTAHKANTEKDPSTCSGSSGMSLSERLKASLGFTTY